MVANYILVHGAGGGGWYWRKVVPLLEAAGHHVLAPDLLGLGDDTSPVDGLSLAAWTEQIVDLVKAQSEPVILVGHSRGGLLVSLVAERIPERLTRLVYVTAFLLGDGQRLIEVAGSDAGSKVGTSVVVDEAAGTFSFPPEIAFDAFMADCSREDFEFAMARMRPEPLFSMVTPVHVTGERFGAVPRDYIECLRDNTISIECQRRMQTVWPCQRVFTLDASHSPQFSVPDALASSLMTNA